VGRACNTNGEKRNAFNILAGNPKEEVDVGGRIILK
jgi:hypothetical protein